MRSIPRLLVATLLLAGITTPALAKNLYVRPIRPGTGGWQLLPDTRIECESGKWSLHFNLLVKGKTGGAFTVVSQHGSFEDVLEFQEFLRKDLRKVKGFRVMAASGTDYRRLGAGYKVTKVTLFLLRAIEF